MSGEQPGRHVLVVEDNPDNRDMLCRRLRRRGFLVTSAANGQQALELAASCGADVVLMDLSLPGIDGWEATRRLRADPATRDLHIIALTAHAMRGDREQALAAGCDAFETKPVDLDRLIGKIEAGRAGSS